MRLRYIETIYYHDGPLSELFIDLETYELYISYIFDDINWIYFVARLKDVEFVNDKDHYNYEIFTTMPDGIDFYKYHAKNLERVKDWSMSLSHFEYECEKITDEERERIRKI